MKKNKDTQAISAVMRGLATYISRAPGKALPKAAQEATKHHLLDTIASMVSGSRLLPGVKAIGYVRALGGAREATVGGGGGSGGPSLDGGGGGGGAILIASSGTVNVTGAVLAGGGAGASAAGGGAGGAGGGGAGGAIRIIATTITGDGTITAAGGSVGDVATAGAPGRIRLEADTITRKAATNPLASVDTPGTIFVAGFPTLRITNVAGTNAPANPTGSADITLPATTPNPVTVVLTTTNVPVGNTVKLTVTPQIGPSTSVISPALTGSTASATASVQATLPVGPSVLQAQTTYTIVASLGDALRNFAGNERVEKITLSATLGGQSKMTLVTVSGKEYEASDEAVRIAAFSGSGN